MALKAAPYEILHGKVQSSLPLTVRQLLDSAKEASATLHDLHPQKNKEEFYHYWLMADIRVHYLQFHYILDRVNSSLFTAAQAPEILKDLKAMMDNEKVLDWQFAKFNKGYMNATELAQENNLRNARIRLLYERLSRNK